MRLLLGDPLGLDLAFLGDAGGLDQLLGRDLGLLAASRCGRFRACAFRSRLRSNAAQFSFPARCGRRASPRRAAISASSVARWRSMSCSLRLLLADDAGERDVLFLGDARGLDRLARGDVGFLDRAVARDLERADALLLRDARSLRSPRAPRSRRLRAPDCARSRACGCSVGGDASAASPARARCERLRRPAGPRSRLPRMARVCRISSERVRSSERCARR